jgi:hypothetical protein
MTVLYLRMTVFYLRMTAFLPARERLREVKAALH